MPVPAHQFDVAVRHQVMLEGVKAEYQKLVVPYLKDLDKRLRLRLTKSELTTYGKKRLNALISSVGDMTENVLSGAMVDLTGELSSLAKAEAVFESKSLDDAVSNVAFNAKTPAASQVVAAIGSTPLTVTGPTGGMLLQPFMKNWTGVQKRSVQNRIRQGVFEGKTNSQILTDIRGTNAAKFKDGLLGLSNAQFRAVVNTAVQHVSSVARMQTYAENADIVQGYEWLSTLDDKTTPICQSLDGRVFKVGEGPIPPAHINCRSTTVAALDDDFDFLKEGATRSSINGPVPANQTYYDWLKGQPVAFQDHALGSKALGKVFRNGDLTSTGFAKMRLNKNFKPLTLAEMQGTVLGKTAFERAGVKVSATGHQITKQTVPAPKSAAQIKRDLEEKLGVGGDPLAFRKRQPKTVTVAPAETLSIQSTTFKTPVTMSKIQSVLAGIPGAQKQVKFLNQFLGKYQTGSVFGLKKHTMRNTYRKEGLHTKFKKYSDDLGVNAPDGGPLRNGVWSGGKAKGFTAQYYNFVVVRVPGIFKNFSSIDPKGFAQAVKKTIEGGLAQSSYLNRPWTYSDDVMRILSSRQAAGKNATQFFTWVHEMGHQIHYRSGAGNPPVALTESLTRYGAKNNREFFAEHFVPWLIDRKALMKAKPKIAKWIDEMVDRAINDPRKPVSDF